MAGVVKSAVSASGTDPDQDPRKKIKTYSPKFNFLIKSIYSYLQNKENKL